MFILPYFVFLILMGHVHAEELMVAVSSNFQPTMESLVLNFNKTDSEKIILIPGPSGKLYAQIKNGAPYDIFFSADSVYPQKLIQENLALKAGSFIYAQGILAICARRLDDLEFFKRFSSTKMTVAVANPEFAPYGQAAKEFLIANNYWNKYKNNIVYGENIAKTMLFFDSGSADVAFVSYSQVKNRKEGFFKIVDQKFYQPIIQEVVILKRGEKNKTAQRFLQFIKSETAKKIIIETGHKAF